MGQAVPTESRASRLARSAAEPRIVRRAGQAKRWLTA